MQCSFPHRSHQEKKLLHSPMITAGAANYIMCMEVSGLSPNRKCWGAERFSMLDFSMRDPVFPQDTGHCLRCLAVAIPLPLLKIYAHMSIGGCKISERIAAS